MKAMIVYKFDDKNKIPQNYYILYFWRIDVTFHHINSL